MVATVSADGTPHAVPVEVVVREALVYAWVESWSVKARNVARGGVAALVAYKGDSFVLVRGPARILAPDDAGYAEVTAAFRAKYRRDDPYENDRLIEITPQRISSRIG